MAEVSNELIYEVLKGVQARLGNMEENQREVRGELRAMRGGIHAVQLDLANIYDTIATLDTRLSRIERRLDIIDTQVP